MKTLNMGILAHVDAGKTSLTERLLFDAGVIGEVGSVDKGSTHTDSLALERQRGITIQSAVVSFTIDDRTVNLIDTPGHSDFIAEVERALLVLDGAVLVVSAVEGVQVQTRVLMRTLARLRIPTLIFVNKIDRMGARYDDLLDDIRAKLAPGAIAMASVDDLGTRAARVRSGWHRHRLAEVLADNDDAFLASYLGGTVTDADCARELVAQTGKALAHPVFFGSAMTGAGVAELVRGIHDLLPGSSGHDDADLHGTVFKIERGSGGEKIAYARLYAGTIGARQQVPYAGQHAKVTAIQVFDHGRSVPTSRVGAGRIAKLWGLADARIGDRLGAAADRPDEHLFSPPTLESVVRAPDRHLLFLALQQLAEQDPLIRVRRNDIGDEITVRLYGEVQKEVIAAQLEADFGVEVTFEATRPILLEKPVSVGSALEEMRRGGNPYPVTVGLRVEPGGSGVGYRLEVELGGLPRAYHTAIEETVRRGLRRGPHGWEVTDCVITLTHTAYDPPMTTAGDFRTLTALVLTEALRRAGTRVYEPVNRFELEVPPDALTIVLAKLTELGATVTVRSDGVLEGVLPAGRVHAFERRLPGMSRGEGVFLSRFDGFQPA
jgi:ribosomal protection tetracycline resistance protein